MAYTFNEDVFVVDCWTDTKEKEQVLKQLLNKLKNYGCPIVLCGHYAVNPEIVKLADYFLYIKDNDILLEKDFVEYGVNSERWTDMGTYRLTNKIDFHHDYAIWVTMKHAFKFVESLGKKYIHFLEYDNLPDEFQYRQAFMEYLRNYNAVVYEYDKDSTKQSNPYSATYLFSIRTDIANQVIAKINSKEIGIVNNITKVISNENNVNMRSINFDTDDGLFEGTIMVFVHDTKHLNHLIENLKKVKGVAKVERIDQK